MLRMVKVGMEKAKQRVYDDLYARLEGKERDDLYSLVRQKERERMEVTVAQW